MSRATACRSEYSLMSMRTMARSSSKRKSASALASSVLPTPVGPRKRNEPVGPVGVGDAGPRCGVRRRDTARTASVWPMSRAPRSSSMRSSFSVSPSSSRPAGMPVQAEMTSAMSSAPTSLLDHRLVAAGRRPRASARLRRGELASRARGSRRRGSRRRRRGRPRAAAARPGCAASSICALRSPTRLRPAFSGSQRALSAASCSERSARSLRSRSSRSREASSVSLLEARAPPSCSRSTGAAQLVDLDRGGVDLHPQPGGRLVDEVDRLVGQLAAGDVAVGQGRGGDQGARRRSSTLWCAS